MGNARDFKLQLDKWFKDECEDRIRLAVQKIGIDILRRVILKTPVDTGRLRGNWLVAIGSPATGTVSRSDKEGDEAIREGSAVITGLSEAQAIHITNNLPYAARIENGHSTQAPAGMVAVTLAEVEAFFARNAA